MEIRDKLDKINNKNARSNTIVGSSQRESLRETKNFLKFFKISKST